MLLGLGLLGCAGADGEDGARGKSGQSAVASVREASDGECPAGGSVLEIGVGDVVEETVICNGADGADGDQGATGEQGPKGARGPQGDAGADAPAGDSIGRIEQSLFCAGGIEDAPFSFSYHAVTFTDGSVWVTGGIQNGAIESSQSQLFAPNQVGAQTGRVIVFFDGTETANGGYWTIEVDRSTLGAEIHYFDPDIAGDLSWLMTGDSSGCQFLVQE